MAQIKVYGHKVFLDKQKELVSNAIHTCTVNILGLPREKRFHRFIPLDESDFIYPDDRSEKYIIIEILMMSGRTTETKKAYIKSLISNVSKKGDIAIPDIEVTLIESPKENWGIRGVTGDELKMNYTVEK
ncbi:tautomerase family protein [Rubellicoccus peritrichatus]|uniref:Tautomerase family protein n=1 Tax=Rubellicoccus peritrichatus TaxID=3080537 RepID=A0AAQ3L6B2_9BACT|nr:tautomerase family protein [Puniceicoccus sp. CR14]WOO39756.1 tautomerase family protein [Puniceicoccus sp. CR14]